MNKMNTGEQQFRRILAIAGLIALLKLEYGKLETVTVCRNSTLLSL